MLLAPSVATSATTSTASVPAPEALVLHARDRGDSRVEQIVAVRDERLEPRAFRSVEDALRAARTRVADDRGEARFGIFGRYQGRVNALAVVDAVDGYRLVRTSTPLDAFQERHGAFSKPAWMRSFHEFARVHDALVALVGETAVVDLRQDGYRQPTSFGRR